MKQRDLLELGIRLRKSLLAALRLRAGPRGVSGGLPLQGAALLPLVSARPGVALAACARDPNESWASPSYASARHPLPQQLQHGEDHERENNAAH